MTSKTLDDLIDTLFKYFFSTTKEKTRAWTEQLVSDTEAVLQPNPGNRVEDFVLLRIEGRRPERMRNLEWLGAHMMAASADFGPGKLNSRRNRLTLRVIFNLE